MSTTPHPSVRRPSAWISRVLIAPIRWYQRLVSPMRPATCRFYPTCSHYAVDALHTHGALVGFWLAARRLMRCHPWTPGGVDHVPPAGRWREVRPPYDPREHSHAEASSSLTSSDAMLDSAPNGEPIVSQRRQGA